MKTKRLLLWALSTIFAIRKMLITRRFPWRLVWKFRGILLWLLEYSSVFYIMSSNSKAPDFEFCIIRCIIEFSYLFSLFSGVSFAIFLSWSSKHEWSNLTLHTAENIYNVHVCRLIIENEYRDAHVYVIAIISILPDYAKNV